MKETAFDQHSFEKKNLVSKEMVFFFPQLPLNHASKAWKCLASIIPQVLLLPLCDLLCLTWWPGGQLPGTSGSGAIRPRHQSLHRSFCQLSLTNLALVPNLQDMVHLYVVKRTHGTAALRCLVFDLRYPASLWVSDSYPNPFKNPRSWGSLEKQNATPRANTRTNSENIHLPCFLDY